MLTWWLIGFVSCLIAFAWLFVSVADDLFVSHLWSADTFMALGISAAIGFAGPFITALIVYWFWDGWRSRFPIDDEGRRLYPW